MENSLFPAPPDILRQRADELRKLISQNSADICQLNVTISLLETGQASLDVKVLNLNTFESCYSTRLFLEELRFQHARLSAVRVKLFEEAQPIYRQLNAMGMNEPAMGSGDQ
jgi:hypothetical protein